MNQFLDFMAQQTVIEYFKLFAVLIASVGAMHFTRNRWLVEKEKLQYELFDRRMRVFDTTKQFVASVIREAHITEVKAHEFRRETSDAGFLFGNDIVVLLKEIDDAAKNLWLACGELDDPHHDRSRHVSVINKKEALEEFSRLSDRMKTAFGRYLTFSERIKRR